MLSIRMTRSLPRIRASSRICSCRWVDAGDLFGASALSADLHASGDVYLTYHMTDPNEFYNREDMWRGRDLPFQPLLVEPYYVLMELPGRTGLIPPDSPFTPVTAKHDRLAVRQERPGNYGDMLASSSARTRCISAKKRSATTRSHDRRATQPVEPTGQRRHPQSARYLGRQQLGLRGHLCICRRLTAESRSWRVIVSDGEVVKM